MKKILFLVLFSLIFLFCSCGLSFGDSTEPLPTTPLPSTPSMECEHSYQVVVVSPTCEEEGYTVYSCFLCGDVYEDNKVAALGHTEEVIPGKAASCEENGLTDGVKCSLCGDILLAQKEISKKEHHYESQVTAPTCESKGYTTYTCSLCADSYKADEVNALGHTEVTVAGKEATCTTPGVVNGTVCSTCGCVLSAQAVIPAKGHSYASSVTAPTCEAAGYTTYTCSACSDTYTGNYVSALGHNYKSVVTTPTCTSGGYTTYTCSVCADSYVASQTSASGHSYSSKVTAPTCESKGYTTYSCSVCSYSYVSKQVAALGHNWQEATYEAPKTCLSCGKTEGNPLAGPLPDDGSGSSSPALYVSYINVGQGDSIFIKIGDCDILIDAGTSSNGSNVVNYMKNQGVDDIELMVNTHPDSDHYGGLTTVMNNFKVEQAWVSPYSKTANTTLKNNLSNRGISYKTPSVGTTFTYDNMKLKVLYNGSGASDSNDSSLVLKLEYGNYSFLFTGDISSTIENKLVSSGVDLKCDVLKVAHHGSKYSSASNFLNATGADYGVICVGAGNSYGHPTSDALNRLSGAGISVYRTDLDGNVVFSTDGSTLTLPGGTSVGGSSSSGSSGSSGSATQYFIGNTESKIFHLPTCGHLPAVSKQNWMYNYWWIINIAGYTPCGHCLKDYNP